MTQEAWRLKAAEERTAHWRRWGPYLSERQWGTVREDYSPAGAAWDFFPHDHARARAYRWGEDGLAGICDNHQRLCFALALWNGRDPILKERLFGLTGSEGNHGEDVKEQYFYLDSTPTHSYMKYLYKYPQVAFPYAQLVEANRQRNRGDLEYELLDTGVFDGHRYYDILVEYAKATPDDLLIRITASNRGPETAELHLLPTLWFRNTWSWEPGQTPPRLCVGAPGRDYVVVAAEHPSLGPRWLVCSGTPALLFTENTSNRWRLHGIANETLYVKDGINDYLVHGQQAAINPARVGTKVAVHYSLRLEAGESHTVLLRLRDAQPRSAPFGRPFVELLRQRAHEADEFYATVIPATLSADAQVDYEPAESRTTLFGGNSNWRGPIWFPVNYLLIEALQKFHYFYGDRLRVPLPTGSERQASLWEVAAELSRCLTRLFLRDADGRRPVYGGTEKLQQDPHWRDLVLFYEYFHGDNGAGLGASHQTGWTALVAKLLQQSGE